MAGVAQVDGWGVVELLGIAAAQHDQIVGHVAKVRVEIGDGKAALSAGTKLPWAAAEDGFRWIVDKARLDDFRQRGGQGFAREFRQLRFRVESIYMTHAAVHVQVDYTLCFCRKRRGFGEQRIGLCSLYDAGQSG